MPVILYALWIILVIVLYWFLIGGWRDFLDFLEELDERRERKWKRKQERRREREKSRSR